MATSPPTRQLISLPRDPLFWLAMLAGPAAWLIAHFCLAEFFGGRADVAHGGNLLLLAGVYPLLEEWLFRGLLQPQLLRYRALRQGVFGFSGANLLTSILFSAAHLFAQPPLWAAATMPPSLIFGAFRDRYESVVPAIILHAFYNLGFFLVF